MKGGQSWEGEGMCAILPTNSPVPMMSSQTFSAEQIKEEYIIII